MIETLANGYSSESTHRELSNEYPHDRVWMVFKNLCIIVLRTKVASALEGLRKQRLHSAEPSAYYASHLNSLRSAWVWGFSLLAGVGCRVQSHAGLVGIAVLYRLEQSPKTSLTYSLSSVAQLKGEITLKSFIYIVRFFCEKYKRDMEDLSGRPCILTFDTMFKFIFLMQ